MAQLETQKLQLISNLEIAKKNNFNELQNQYLNILLINYTIQETIEHCLKNKIPLHFQTLYSVVVSLWKTNCIQNKTVCIELEKLNRKTPETTFLKSISKYILPLTQNKFEKPSIEQIGQLPFFNTLPFKWLHQLYSTSTLIEAQPQNLILREGTKSRDLYLLLEGTVTVYKRSDNKNILPITQIKGPSLFGEGGFFFNHPRSADVVADTPCRLMRFLFQPDYETQFKVQNEKAIIERFWLLHALNKSDLFSDVPLETINHVLTIGTTKRLSKNQILFSEGEQGDNFYILIQGQLDVEQKGKIINTLKEGKCFGELALLASQGRRTATIIGRSDCLLYEISRQDFYPFLAKNLFLAKDLERIAEIRIQRDRKRQMNT